MKSNNTDIAVNWFMALPFDERIAIANKYYPQYAEDNTDLDDAEIEHIYFSEYPIMPDYKTWWKGLNEEEQTKLCQKHFQGIPVESLMERSIKVMYHYENPETTTNTVTGEIKLWVTGSGGRTGNLTANDVLLRTDDATIHFNKESEFGKLAHAMINRYNSHDSLVSALKKLQYQLQTHAESNAWDMEDEAAYEEATTVLNQINQL